MELQQNSTRFTRSQDPNVVSLKFFSRCCHEIPEQQKFSFMGPETDLTIIRKLHPKCYSATVATGSTLRARSLLILCGATREDTEYAPSLGASQQLISEKFSRAAVKRNYDGLLCSREIIFTCLRRSYICLTHRPQPFAVNFNYVSATLLAGLGSAKDASYRQGRKRAINHRKEILSLPERTTTARNFRIERNPLLAKDM